MAATLAALTAATSPLTALALDPTLARSGQKTNVPPFEFPASVEPPAGSAAPRPSAPAAPVVRQPLPSAADLEKANRLIDQVYKDDLAAVAKVPDQRRAVAQKFLQTAIDTKTDPAGQYALLTRAMDVAADAGEVDTVIQCSAEVDRSFDTGPVVPADLDVYARAQKNARGVEAQRPLARHLMTVARLAVLSDRLDAAGRAIDLAVASAGRANDPVLLRSASARAKDVREIEAAHAQAASALAAVDKGGANPAQNSAAGRYRCLYQGDWAAGLPLLAAGGDPALKDLAAKDSAGPADAAVRLAVGDAWWDAAETLADLPRNLAIVRARHWYALAAPTLTGLPKAKAAMRMKETESLAAAYGEKAPTAAPANPAAAAPPAAARLPAGAKVPVPPLPAGALGQLPPAFSREWTAPESWAGKPEAVTIKDGKVSITNEGGANVVCTDAPLAAQKDGTLVLQWDYGPAKSGYEVWKIHGAELSVSRWNTKAEKDGGRPARRTGGTVPAKPQ